MFNEDPLRSTRTAYVTPGEANISYYNKMFTSFKLSPSVCIRLLFFGPIIKHHRMLTTLRYGKFLRCVNISPLVLQNGAKTFLQQVSVLSCSAQSLKQRDCDPVTSLQQIAADITGTGGVRQTDWTCDRQCVNEREWNRVTVTECVCVRESDSEYERKREKVRKKVFVCMNERD
jgi:hypothetical protein